MKLKSLFLLAAAALLTCAMPRTARAIDVSFDFFYNSLSPYGEWVEVGDYGNCWRPNGVDEDWAPYSDGYWAYTDAGWTWVSYEDFGGIVYHYGRWAKVEDEGWVWVPDYEWGPAWVSWRRNDDYVGWAPLPAEAQFRRDRGISVWADTSYDIGPSSYNFCHLHDFGAPVLRPLIVRRTENFVIIGDTVNITNITYNDRAGCAFNGGLDYGYVNRYARRPIPALKLVRNNNVTVVNNYIVNNNTRVTNFNAVQRGNQLSVIAPNVARPQAEQLALARSRATRVIPQSKVTKGWNVVPQEQREALRAKFAQQTQGKTPETAPATPLQAAELKVVPVKADPKAKLPGAQPIPNAKGREVQPAPPAATATGNPVPQATPATIAGKPGRKQGKVPSPVAPATPAVTENPPATPTNPAVAAERPVKGRPGVTKPFNPTATEPQTPAAAPTATEPTAAQTAAEARRNAVAAKQAAIQQQKQEALRQRQELAQPRTTENPPDSQSPAAVQPPAPARRRSQDNGAAQQRMLEQQQQNQQEAVARKQEAAQQQQQQLRQNAEVAKERAMQRPAAPEPNPGAAQQQQAQAAAARREAVERAQAQRQQMQQQQQRPVPQQPQVQQQQQPAVQNRKPAPNGKKPLTSEEAAKQQGQ